MCIVTDALACTHSMHSTWPSSRTLPTKLSSRTCGNSLRSRPLWICIFLFIFIFIYFLFVIYFWPTTDMRMSCGSPQSSWQRWFLAWCVSLAATIRCLFKRTTQKWLTKSCHCMFTNLLFHPIYSLFINIIVSRKVANLYLQVSRWMVVMESNTSRKELFRILQQRSDLFLEVLLPFPCSNMHSTNMFFRDYNMHSQ